MSKQSKGQFYTTNVNYIFDGFSIPETASAIIEPFAGQGDLLNWIGDRKVLAYDIDPKIKGIIKRDTLKAPPEYKNAFIITNPPFLARNKSKEKEVYDMYKTNDLYKCFLISALNCEGGILILPAGFFFSPREADSQLRHAFMSRFKILKIRYFEETVFDDTTTTVVAFQFEKSSIDSLETQNVLWEFLPSNSSRIFEVNSKNKWIVGGEIYNLPLNKNITISRYISASNLNPGEQLTFLTLNALDSGSKKGRHICLEYKKDYIYPSKESSRTYATLKIKGVVLNLNEQEKLSMLFNDFIDKKREEFHSLFLPQYREAKDYARKRIPFELAYSIVNYIISSHLK